jgi:hypothetical protein
MRVRVEVMTEAMTVACNDKELAHSSKHKLLAAAT